jgi:hypothetical protein
MIKWTPSLLGSLVLDRSNHRKLFVRALPKPSISRSLRLGQLIVRMKVSTQSRHPQGKGNKLKRKGNKYMTMTITFRILRCLTRNAHSFSTVQMWECQLECWLGSLPFYRGHFILLEGVYIYKRALIHFVYNSCRDYRSKWWFYIGWKLRHATFRPSATFLPSAFASTFGSECLPSRLSILRSLYSLGVPCWLPSGITFGPFLLKFCPRLCFTRVIFDSFGISPPRSCLPGLDLQNQHAWPSEPARNIAEETRSGDLVPNKVSQYLRHFSKCHKKCLNTWDIF